MYMYRWPNVCACRVMLDAIDVDAMRPTAHLDYRDIDEMLVETWTYIQLLCHGVMRVACEDVRRAEIKEPKRN